MRCSLTCEIRYHICTGKIDKFGLRGDHATNDDDDHFLEKGISINDDDDHYGRSKGPLTAGNLHCW